MKNVYHAEISIEIEAKNINTAENKLNIITDGIFNRYKCVLEVMPSTIERCEDFRLPDKEKGMNEDWTGWTKEIEDKLYFQVIHAMKVMRESHSVAWNKRNNNNWLMQLFTGCGHCTATKRCEYIGIEPYAYNINDQPVNKENEE